MFFVIGTVQTGRVPRQAPVHFPNRQPFAGVARSWSDTYDGNAAEQRGAQEIPGRALLIEPLPAREMVSR